MNLFKKLALLIILLVLGGCYTIIKVSGTSKPAVENREERCRRYWHPCIEHDWCMRWQYYYCYPWWYEDYWFWRWQPREHEPRPSTPTEKEQNERRRGLKSEPEKKEPEKNKTKEEQDTLKTEPIERRRGL